MNLSFLEGLIIGFIYAAPVGPIGVLCIRRTLTQGLSSGLISGMGCATATSLYSSLIGLSMSSITQLLSAYQFWLRLLSSSFLCYLGSKIFLTKLINSTYSTKSRRYLTSYWSTFALVFTDPNFPFFLIALAKDFSFQSNYDNIKVFSLGVFWGEALWWLILCGVCRMLQSHLNPRILQWLNRLSGGAIFGFGLKTLWSLKF